MTFCGWDRPRCCDFDERVVSAVAVEFLIKCGPTGKEFVRECSSGSFERPWYRDTCTGCFSMNLF